LNIQDYRGAIADFSRAIELNPEYSQAYFNRGCQQRFSLGKTIEGAIADFSRTIELKPENSQRLYYNRGLSKGRLGKTIEGAMSRL
jgi:tetratricopeptide (TPR) repeat protein